MEWRSHKINLSSFEWDAEFYDKAVIICPEFIAAIIPVCSKIQKIQKDPRIELWKSKNTLCTAGAIDKTITWGKISKRLYSRKNENDLKRVVALLQTKAFDGQKDRSLYWFHR